MTEQSDANPPACVNVCVSAVYSQYISSHPFTGMSDHASLSASVIYGSDTALCRLASELQSAVCSYRCASVHTPICKRASPSQCVNWLPVLHIFTCLH